MTHMLNSTRILHLVSADGDWEPAVRVIGLAAALREHGLSSAITAPDHSRLWEVAEAAGVEVIDYTLESSLNPLRWMDLSKMIKSTASAIIHSHDPEASRLLSRSKMFSGDTAVVTSRYDLKTQPGAAEYGAAVKAIVCPSEALAESFRKHNDAAQKVRVVYDGVALPTADRALEERDVLRTRYREAYCPNKEKPLFIVNIAPLEPGHGQADLLEAMTEVVAALPQTHLFIMGEGTLREELERQVKITALDKDVAFLEPDKAFIRLLAASDLFVSASDNDVSGFMVQAAMAASTAVVLKNAGCYPELIEDGKTGVFTPGPGVDGLKAGILDLLENRNRREHLGRMAKARAEKAFNMAGQAGRIAEIYGEVLASGK